MGSVQPTFRKVSEVVAPADTVWEQVTTQEGINAELRPYLKMTMPAAFRGKSMGDASPGTHIGKSVLLLFGVIPFGYDNITVAQCVFSFTCLGDREDVDVLAESGELAVVDVQMWAWPASACFPVVLWVQAGIDRATRIIASTPTTSVPVLGSRTGASHRDAAQPMTAVHCVAGAQRSLTEPSVTVGRPCGWAISQFDQIPTEYGPCAPFCS